MSMDNANYYNAYQNPQPMAQPQYPQRPTYPQPPPPQNYPPTNCDFIQVSGIEQVREHIVFPGQKLYFLDNNKPLMYTKEANSLGTTNIETYSVTKVEETEAIRQPSNEFDDLRREIDICMQRIDELEKSQVAPRQNDGYKKNYRRDGNEPAGTKPEQRSNK